MTARYLGPYNIIEKISTHAYRLALLLSLKRLHNVFHVSLLEKYHPRSSNGPTEDQLEIELVDDHFELEQLVDYYDGKYKAK